MNGSSTSATPSFRCHSFSIETKKMNTFEFRRRTHYTQKGILPSNKPETHLIVLVFALARRTPAYPRRNWRTIRSYPRTRKANQGKSHPPAQSYHSEKNPENVSGIKKVGKLTFFSTRLKFTYCPLFNRGVNLNSH